MIADKKTFTKGSLLLGSFTLVFVLIFMPLFDKGQNGLEYLDDLYNSISKGSAYYIPKLQDEVKTIDGKMVSMKLNTENAAQAGQTAELMKKSGADVVVKDNVVEVKGDLGKILDNCLKDADLMYHNDGAAVKEKYGFDERLVLYTWWKAGKLMDKDLKRQKLFKEAMVVTNVEKKGVETSYNFYKIEPQKISGKLGVVIFSLVFYVVYTIWYGFAIMYLFEGWGLRLEH